MAPHPRGRPHSGPSKQFQHPTPAHGLADGTQGFPPAAPYDRVIATCSFPQLPAPGRSRPSPAGRS
ncbi:MAG: hypothetical protein ACRDQ4_22750 [Pseudonocardiaceae bacterium]